MALAPLLLSLAAAISPLPALSPSTIATPTASLCALDAGTCRAAEPPADDSEVYATPAEVDCRAVIASTATPSRSDLHLVSACSFPIVDFRYRVSRVPDSERPSGSLGPQRPRRTKTTVATTSGVPHEQGGLTTLASNQPIAVFALGALAPPSRALAPSPVNSWASTRIVEPLDRPPRA
jgi:hypothetical protein